MFATYLKKKIELKRFMKKSKGLNAWPVGIKSEDAIDLPCIYSIVDVVIVS